MAELKLPGQPPEAEPLTVEHIGPWVRISVGEVQLTVNREEHLAQLVESEREAA